MVDRLLAEQDRWTEETQRWRHYNLPQLESSAEIRHLIGFPERGSTPSGLRALDGFTKN